MTTAVQTSGIAVRKASSFRIRQALDHHVLVRRERLAPRQRLLTRWQAIGAAFVRWLVGHIEHASKGSTTRALRRRSLPQRDASLVHPEPPATRRRCGQRAPGGRSAPDLSARSFEPAIPSRPYMLRQHQLVPQIDQVVDVHEAPGVLVAARPSGIAPGSVGVTDLAKLARLGLCV